MKKIVFFILISISTQAQTVTALFYGAKGDGVTDDSKAFNSFFKSKNSELVLLKNKTYRIKKKLQLGSNKTILGNDAKIIGDYNLEELFVGIDKNAVTIKNVVLVGSHYGNQTAFLLKNVSNFSFENSKMNEFSSANKFKLGIFCEGNCDNMIVKNNQINNISGTESGSGYAIHITDSKNFQFLNNVFKAEKGDGRHAIYLSSGSQNGLVSNNEMYNYDCGAIQLYSFYYQNPTKNNVLENNLISGCNNRFDFEGAITIFQNCNNNIIRNNTIKNSGAYGILLSGDTLHAPMSKCMNNEIFGNKIESCVSAGIATWGAHNTKIIQNEISNSNWNNKDKTLTALGVYNDVNNNGNNEGTEVADNIVLNNPNCRFDIRIYSDTNGNVSVKGNKTRGDRLIDYKK